MGIRGPRPKHPALRVYDRTRRGAVQAVLNDAGLLNKVPPVPEHLDEVAAARWPIVCKELISLKLLTMLDLGCVESFCAAWSRSVKAETALANEPLIKTNDRGVPYANPLIRIAANAQESMRKLANDLGLTPSARLRLHDPKATPVLRVTSRVRE